MLPFTAAQAHFNSDKLTTKYLTSDLQSNVFLPLYHKVLANFCQLALFTLNRILYYKVSNFFQLSLRPRQNSAAGLFTDTARHPPREGPYHRHHWVPIRPWRDQIQVPDFENIRYYCGIWYTFSLLRVTWNSNDIFYLLEWSMWEASDLSAESGYTASRM